MIDTATNTLEAAALPVGRFPWGVAVTPDGRKVYIQDLITSGQLERFLGKPLDPAIFKAHLERRYLS